MNMENDSVSFGRYLKSKRLEKGISLKMVSGETRIGLDTLAHIEDEDVEKLPAEVFTKGFLRAYAKAVGADGDEAFRRRRLAGSAQERTRREGEGQGENR